MQTTVERGTSRGTTAGASASAESDSISARGLEILRVLNDVFNTFPADSSEWQEATHADHAPVGAAGF